MPFSTSQRLVAATFFLAVAYGPTAHAQDLDSQAARRFTLQVHYGANGNFFTSTQVTEGPREFVRTHFLGTAGGGAVAYRLTPASALSLEYTRSVNSRPVRFVQLVGPTNTPIVSDLRIRYLNNAFQAVYERSLSRSGHWKAHAGLLYLTTASQSVQLGSPVVVSEINRRNSYSEEAGVVAGLEYSRPIDTRLRLGLKVRGYYLATVSTFEMLTLTPTLSYQL
ncbi:hypothetical protein [Hymenobacter glacieicola]|uniref:Outer membrane protein beta-barrel domain-containing protein n=1 Tax=Hymenobacter glacieicola TaxID=1562124 RepID=A0ABQ1WNR9_9BACT|nr:hypothetical protein [Hymenobacter glacieicola]GGG39758.1 hypothetical protein GCM10011378_15050 [Hymenobacter glacieicola]